MDDSADWSGFALVSEDRYITSLVGESTGHDAAVYFVNGVCLGENTVEPYDPPISAIDTLEVGGCSGEDFAAGYFDDITVDMSP